MGIAFWGYLPGHETSRPRLKVENGKLQMDREHWRLGGLVACPRTPFNAGLGGSRPGNTHSAHSEKDLRRCNKVRYTGIYASGRGSCVIEPPVG